MNGRENESKLPIRRPAAAVGGGGGVVVGGDDDDDDVTMRVRIMVERCLSIIERRSSTNSTKCAKVFVQHHCN